MNHWRNKWLIFRQLFTPEVIKQIADVFLKSKLWKQHQIQCVCIGSTPDPENEKRKQETFARNPKGLNEQQPDLGLFFWLLEGKVALSQHEHVCKWLQRLGTQIWSSHSEITAVDRRGADSRNKLELFANWAISGWGKGVGRCVCVGGANAAPIFCNTFIHRTKKKMPPTWDFKDRPFLHTQNECIWKKQRNKCRNARGGGKTDSCHIPSHKDVRYAWSQVRL